MWVPYEFSDPHQQQQHRNNSVKHTDGNDNEKYDKHSIQDETWIIWDSHVKTSDNLTWQSTILEDKKWGKTTSTFKKWSISLGEQDIFWEHCIQSSAAEKDFAKLVKQFLQKRTVTTILSHSPDLNLCDIFLLLYLKNAQDGKDNKPLSRFCEAYKKTFWFSKLIWQVILYSRYKLTN